MSLAGLLALLGVCSVFFWSTRDNAGSLSFLRRNLENANAVPGEITVVNLQPWQTAEALTALAASAEEIEYAREAEHLADHEVDQSFAAALRKTTMQRRALTGEAVALTDMVATLQKTLGHDKARIRELTAHDPDEDLEVAKAQLDFDTDQFTEAQQDWERAGGDQRGQIKEEYSGTHTSAVSVRFQDFVIPFFSTNLCAGNKCQ